MKKYAGLLLLIFGALLNSAVTAAEETENYDSYIVKYKPDTVHLLSADETPIEFAENFYVVDGEDIDNFRGNPNIEYIEPDYDVELFGCPDDVYYEQQWSLIDWGYNNIFGTVNNGSGTRIGVIDSGVYASHPDLECISDDSYNVLTGDSTCTDTYGHGTFISGIIGATVNNSIGIAGLAPETEIVMIKCFEDSSAKTSNIISAINYAAEMDLDVVNMSFGTSFSDTGSANSLALKEAIDNLAASGAIMVAAVGNGGDSTVNYPAGYDNVIGVGSIASDFTIASTSQINESVFVTAPGEKVCGLWSPDTGKETYYRKGSGTSFAAPYVVALAAWARSYDETIDFDGFCELLKNSVKDLGDEGYDTTYGWGAVNPKVFWDCLTGGTKVFVTQPSCAADDSGRGITCSQTVINNSGADLNFYYALYENGRFKEVKSCELSDETYVEFDNDLSEDSVIKCFVWDSLNGVMPYFDSMTIY